MVWTRRGLLASLAAMGTAGAVWAEEETPAQTEPSIFAGTALDQNEVAHEFIAPPSGLVLPKNARIAGGKGVPRTLEGYRGKTILLSLWAEWCVPCLMEMPAFAILDQRYANDKFQIVPVLSDTNFRSLYEVKPLLNKIGADSLPMIMDNSEDSNFLSRSLARSAKDKTTAYPCNMLVDPTGVIRGRSIGGATFKNARGEFSIWASADGVAFTQALANGLLEAKG